MNRKEIFIEVNKDFENVARKVEYLGIERRLGNIAGILAVLTFLLAFHLSLINRYIRKSNEFRKQEIELLQKIVDKTSL